MNGKIAFASNADGDYDIYTINPDGSGLTKITNNQASDTSPAWSPDGNKIAFVSNRDGSYQIWVMNADGTGAIEITNDTFNTGLDSDPAWSPDGTKIAFTKNDGGYCDTPTEGIFVMNAPYGGSQTRVTCVDRGEDDVGSAWSPDGSRILFANANAPGGTEVWSVKPDGTGLTNVTNSGGLVQRDADPNWSPSAAQITFSRLEDSPTDVHTHIWTMNADGTGQAKITTTNTVDDRYPVWSPNGQKIAFNRGGQLYVMNTDGTAQTPLASGLADPNVNIDWQPLERGYPRPKGATPYQTYFTVAYKPCDGSSANRQHGAPLAALSCSPPQQTSDYLTVGTLDSNGQPAKLVGSVRLDVQPGNPATSANEADVKVAFSVTDVRNKSDLTPYVGQLDPEVLWRDTDHWNGPIGANSGSEPGTSGDLTEPLSPNGVQCTPNPLDATAGSICQITTSMNSVVPGMVQEGKRMNVELGQVQVYDGGADGVAGSMSDNTLFLDEGIFVP